MPSEATVDSLPKRRTQDVLRDILVLFLITRLLVWVGIYGLEIIGIDFVDWKHGYADIPAYLSPLVSWDSEWYILIAQDGYTYVPDATDARYNLIAFFPLYPMMIAVGEWMLQDHTLTALVISNLSLLIALYYLYRLQELWFGSEAAWFTVATFLFYPLSFYLSVPYAESLMFALTFAAVYYARLQRWWVAALLAGFASAVRIPGILVMGVIGYEWLLAHGWRLVDSSRRRAWYHLWQGIQRDWFSLLAICTLPFLGLGSYIGYQAIVYDNPLAFLEAAKNGWGTIDLNPISQLIVSLSNFAEIKPYNLPYLELWAFLAMVMALAVTLLVVSRNYHGGYVLYVLIATWYMMPRLEGMMRYVLMFFPVFLGLGLLLYRHRLLRRSYYIVGGMLLVFFSFAYESIMFVG